MPTNRDSIKGLSLLVMRSGLVNFSVIRKRLMRILAHIAPLAGADDDEFSSLTNDLPEDVKEGHFVVHTVNGEVKRFIIELSCLSHPEFLKLLEQAKEEFGFKQEGVLAVPCQSGELRKILESMKESKFPDHHF